MDFKYEVTVLTPTYNRCHTLNRLYDSLCKQTENSFQWLIIDDGSTDETEQYIGSLLPSGFEINYYKKENGGKHTALNYSHPLIKGKVTVIVDSDDYLLPDAIQTIETDWKKYEMESDIGVISYMRAKENGDYFSKKNTEDYYIDDDIHYLINKGISGDRCETLRTDLLRKYPFPVFAGEKFMSEGWFWNNLALNYKTVYRNEEIYICEYLEGGLTKTGRRLRMECPLGMMENCKSFFQKEVCWRIQIKEMLLFWVYGFCADYSFLKIAQESGRKLRMYLCMPAGVLLHTIWKRKYL